MVLRVAGDGPAILERPEDEDALLPGAFEGWDERARARGQDEVVVGLDDLVAEAEEEHAKVKELVARIEGMDGTSSEVDARTGMGCIGFLRKYSRCTLFATP